MKILDKQKIKLLKLFSQEADGSLPEVSIDFNDADHLAEAVSFLTAHGKIDSDQSIWSEKDQKELRYSDVPKKLFDETLTDSQHVQLRSLFDLPELGMTVLGKSIFLDFETGESWNSKSINGLVKVLGEMKENYKATKTSLDEEGIFFLDQQKEFFEDCFN